MDDVTSRLLADITMAMVTLAVGHGQTVTGLLCDITEKGHHIWDMTDINLRTVPLTAQHKCTTQVL